MSHAARHLAARELSAAQGGRQVFNGLDLDVRSGEVLALLGANGCGKTTLLRSLLGLHPLAAGEVLLDGVPLTTLPSRERARLIAYVPQYHRLAFGYRVLDVVLMGRLAGRGMLARPSREDEHLAREALAQMGVADLAERAYTELSGGQRQLVLIARALAQDAVFMLLDEPSNNLDYGNQLRLLQRIRALAGTRHGILFTTHHPEHAHACATRAVLMKQGRILASGEPARVLDAAGIRDLYDLAPDMALGTCAAVL